MFRQNMAGDPNGVPPIPVMVEAEINVNDYGGMGGGGGRSQVSMLDDRSTATGTMLGHNDYNGAIPRQPRHPDSMTGSTLGTGRRTESLVRNKSCYLVEEQLTDLEEMGYPKGLASELGRTRSLFPARFWVIDNSGSMLNNDGHTIRGTASVPCTRWNELQETVMYHAELAAVLQATTHFRMLNDPGVRVGPQEFSIADQGRSVREEIQMAKKIIQHTKPNGATPLTDHLTEIAERISEMEGPMRQQGLEAVVILATDGLPTSHEGETSDEINNEFIHALSRLQTLPVWIVIRLCTDEFAVVDFYNALDSVLELPLEVLDDHLHEAKECHQHNSWLNYALPLHRCREIGYQHRIFDLLDERPLNKDEVKEFCSVLLGPGHFKNCPDVHNDWSGFLKHLGHVLKDEKPHFNPLTQKLAPWIDTAQLKKSFSGGVFGIFKKRISGTRI